MFLDSPEIPPLPSQPPGCSSHHSSRAFWAGMLQTPCPGRCSRLSDPSKPMGRARRFCARRHPSEASKSASDRKHRVRRDLPRSMRWCGDRPTPLLSFPARPFRHYRCAARSPGPTAGKTFGVRRQAAHSNCTNSSRGTECGPACHRADNRETRPGRADRF